MLKIVKTSIAVTIASLSFANVANAGIEDDLANICHIVQADDKGELRKKMRRVQTDYRLKLHDYYTGISCGGNSLIRTAVLSNAVETGTLLVKKMPSRDLEKPESDGKTLQAWIAEQGHQSSPIAAELDDRI
ncbi:DUF3718 domain-containing protein [Alteromonas halophila]|uniref:DUF3718 domain-containing protein n=1 Tax=Alteromonas halophila TaxID=516698 RepID=A0A918JQ72_9ALTE|nr:DUF3718 domain-containing protein [Alteromonas halophila]GGW89535.1 hypothetical protein GCM10007391_24770 [Alteromonas halophila]